MRCGGRLLASCCCSPCSGDGTWFGGDEEVPLPGERVAVMLLERQLTADPQLADLPIRLPPPVVNPEWPQNGGDARATRCIISRRTTISTLAWQRRRSAAAHSGDSQLLARPVVAEGRVYTMDAEGLISAFDADERPAGLAASSPRASMPRTACSAAASPTTAAGCSRPRARARSSA